MKKSILYIASLLIAAVGFSACDDEKAMPPMYEPGSDKVIPATNTTILELKEAFNDPNTYSYNKVIGEKADGSHYVITGKIVSCDKAGNIYKNLMIEDETAGLTIAVDKTKLYEDYKPGQLLTIDCTGLRIGAYGNCMQLGGEPQPGKEQPGRIDEEIFTEHAIVHGFPTPVAPQVVTVPEVDAARQNNVEFLAMQSRLVKFENMEFENPGEPLATQGQSTSRYAFDENGNRIQLYNSGQSTFWFNSLPGGKGDIVGVLSFYNREWQILLIDLESLENFSGSTAPVIPVFSETFANGTGSFTIEDETIPSGLQYVWTADSRYACMKASAFANSTNYKTSSYLVSPEINLANLTEVSASFEQAVNYYASVDAAKEESTFVVREIGGEWETLEIPHYPSSLSWTFMSTGQIDLSKYAGKKIQVAFHYTSDTKAGTWEVKNLKVNGFN